MAEGEAKKIFTIGSSNRSLQEFLDLLKAYEIIVLVDVRIFPYSRRFPHFIKECLEESIHASGLKYRYLGKELGGYRKGGYEACMGSPNFAKGIEALEALGGAARTAFMCSERLPWKCHRRFIAQELLHRGWEVIHIIDSARTWQPKSR